MITRILSSLLFLAAINTGIVRAQVVPDGTLPTVVEELENMRKITGGERVGDNLFHSFEEFSIPEGIEAIFENGLDIENIFTRITGSDISVIDGLLKTAGAANFFLINPNGIIFGENAQLDIGGSFIATTANKIEFADGTNFDARGDEPKVTLTISVPIGIRLDGNNGSITVNGSGNQITNTSFGAVRFSQQPSGLSTNNDRTLALVGNGINFNGGVVSTEGGNIYLSSISSGKVGITQSENGLSLINDSVNNYQNIALNQESLLYSFNQGEGNISVIGKNINLVDGSFILSQNSSNTSGGLLNVKAAESLTLSGQSSENNIFSAIRSETLGTNTGEGANINILANQLLFQDGGRIQASTYNNALGGNINVNVSDLIQLDGASISSSTFAGGDSGNIELSTSELRIIDGGLLTSSAFGEEDGNGGNLNIKADLIEVIGNATGDSANNTSTISSTSFNAGNAGNLTIETLQLNVLKGGVAVSSSFGSGNTGTLEIKATESINVSGIANDSTIAQDGRSSIGSSVVPANPSARQILGLPEVPTGDAGSLNIHTPSLNISEDGIVSVQNQGTGSAGRLTINADNLNIDKAGTISAAASSGLGGNIEVNTQNLNISNNSQITAVADGQEDGGNITINTTNLTARTSHGAEYDSAPVSSKKNNQITASANSGDGGNIILNADSVSLNDRDEISAASSSRDGGNININADILTALEQSKITASAISGDGGNITINSRGYFVSEDSVVSASSEFGLDGTININSLENNFQQDLDESEVEIAIIPDFFIPRCANPDRAYLSLFPGDVLRESPDNYYSYPSQTDTDVLLQEPEYQEKLDRIVQRYLERLESEPEPEPEIEEPETESERTSQADEETRRSQGAEDTSAHATSSSDVSSSGLIWQPGDPMINATEIVETEDGEVFLVPPAEKQEFLRLLRCGQSVN